MKDPVYVGLMFIWLGFKEKQYKITNKILNNMDIFIEEQNKWKFSANKHNGYFLFYQFPIAAVAKQHKLSWSKQHKFITSQFWKSEAWNWSYLASIKFVGRAVFLPKF